MKTVETKLYSFGELSPDARRRALSDYREGEPYRYIDEFKEIVAGFETRFGVRVDWSFDESHGSAHLRPDGGRPALDLRGNRARAWLWNNCGDWILKPRTTAWTRRHGKFVRAVSKDSVAYRSHVFSVRACDGACPITGTFLDVDALEPMAMFCYGLQWGRDENRYARSSRRTCDDESTSVADVAGQCLADLAAAASRDFAYQQGEECFASVCEANEYWFHSNGRMHDE